MADGMNYHYCPVCWRAAPQAEFLPDSNSWQFLQRCIDCEKVYVEAFKAKYPGTKSKKRFKKLTSKERTSYEKMMEFERYFLELEEENINE